MTWKQRLRPASFRGIPFLVDDRDLVGGRRRARHEFFRRDKPFLEDLGRRAREYRVRVHLLGDDYDLERAQLVEAFELADGGELILPHDEPLLAIVTEWRVRESVTGAGGVAEFDVTFEERGEVPTEGEGAEGAQAQTAARLYRAGAATALEDELVFAGVPESAREATSNELTAWAERFEGLQVLEGFTDELASFQTKVTGLLASASDLALDPAQLAADVRDTVETILDAATDAAGALYAYRTLFGIERTAGLDDGSSVGSQAARENAQAVNQYVRGQVIASAVEAAAAVTWPSRNEAEESLAELLAEIDALEHLVEEPVLGQLQDLRAAAVPAIPPPGASLPVAVDYVLPATRSTLVLAYELFDDALREDVVADRNNVEHPGFLPAGEVLEVLVEDGP